MLWNKRLAALYPLMGAAAINIAIYSSVFVRMLVDTMDDITKWDDAEKTSNALLCMLGLGAGEIIGSLVFGKVTDKLPFKTIIVINTITLTVGYGCLFLYGAVYDFSFYLGVLLTFAWGVQDSGMNCLLNSVLGFQFESKTIPFSVYKFLQSLLIFVFICIEVATKSQKSYLIYFFICYVVSMAAWLILATQFTFKTKEEVE